MDADIRCRLLAAQLAVAFADGRPATVDDVMDAACAFYDFLTADFGAEEDEDDEPAPDNAQSYPN